MTSPPSRGRRRLVLFGLVAVLAIGVAAWMAMMETSFTRPTAARVEDEPSGSTAAEFTTVERRDLIEVGSATGLVGYGPAWILPIEAEGLVTSSPPVGTVVEVGEEVLRIDERPVFLALGDLPLYRELRLVGHSERDETGARLGLMEGGDVHQLQEFLSEAGFDDAGRMGVDGVFGLSTQRAVKAWQKESGHLATGVVDRSQLVFSPGSIRVQALVPVASPLEPVEVTGVEPTVQLRLDPLESVFFPAGTTVALDGPGVSVRGEVTASRQGMDEDGTRFVEAEVDPDASLGDLAVVTVSAQRTVVANVPSVPVRALTVLADGGWALNQEGVGLTPVEVGEVVDGMAEIDGVEPGIQVVIPR